MPFINPDFMLTNDTARELYHGSAENMPTFQVGDQAIGRKLLDIMAEHGMVASKSEGRRLIQQSGISLNDGKISDVDYVMQESDFVDGAAILKKGKKKFYKLTK